MTEERPLNYKCCRQLVFSNSNFYQYNKTTPGCNQMNKRANNPLKSYNCFCEFDILGLIAYNIVTDIKQKIPFGNIYSNIGPQPY